MLHKLVPHALTELLSFPIIHFWGEAHQAAVLLRPHAEALHLPRQPEILVSAK